MFVRNIDGGVHAVTDDFPVPEGWAVIQDPGPALAPEGVASEPATPETVPASGEVPPAPAEPPAGAGVPNWEAPADAAAEAAPVAEVTPDGQ